MKSRQREIDVSKIARNSRDVINLRNPERGVDSRLLRRRISRRCDDEGFINVVNKLRRWYNEVRILQLKV